MPERETAEPERGTPPGSPSSTSDPKTDSDGDRSHPQPRDGATTSAPEPATEPATRVGQLGEGTHPGPVDRRLAPDRTAPCGARCGSAPMGPPLVRGKAGWGSAGRRRDEDGGSSNLSSDSPSPQKTETLSADRSDPAAWSSYRGWTNPQVGGFITLVMSPLITSRPPSSGRPAAGPDMAPKAASSQVGGFITLMMSPLITFRPWSWIRPSSRPDMAPKGASSQVGGLITLVRGLHHARTASTSAALAPMEGITAPTATRPPSPLPPRTPAAPTAAERRPECSRTWWGRHMASSQPQGASGIASAGSTGQRRDRVSAVAPARTRGKVTEPTGFTIESPSAPIKQAHKAEEAGSKMVKQVPCLRGRCRWPRPGSVPEVSSGSLRWPK